MVRINRFPELSKNQKGTKEEIIEQINKFVQTYIYFGKVNA